MSKRMILESEDWTIEETYGVHWRLDDNNPKRTKRTPEQEKEPHCRNQELQS